jgi:hypothetical protein
MSVGFTRIEVELMQPTDITPQAIYQVPLVKHLLRISK